MFHPPMTLRKARKINMINTAGKGRRYEWKIRDKYIAMGYRVFRSRASRGAVDLIAINPQTKIICLIQCKASKIYKPEREKIMKEISKFTGNYVVVGVIE